MMRLLHMGALALALGSQTACMNLDFLVWDNPQTKEYAIDADFVDPSLVEFVTFEAEDGTTLHGAWLRQPVPGAPPLIYFHGNQNHIGTVWERTAYLGSWGYDVFVFDYRGFGRSEGEPSIAGVFGQDGIAAAEYVSRTSGVPQGDIPWAATSLGAAVAMHTNDDVAAQALILESAYASMDQLLDGGTALDLPDGWFWRDDFDNVRAIRKIQSPAFIIHGLADDFIDPASAELLFDAAPDPKLLWQPRRAQHSDLHLVEPDAFRDRARAWFDDHGGVPELPLRSTTSD